MTKNNFSLNENQKIHTCSIHSLIIKFFLSAGKSFMLKKKNQLFMLLIRERDNFTSEFIKKNETKRLYTLVSLTLICNDLFY